MLFLREVLVTDLFNYRKGSVERGQVWDNIANRLNALEFPKFQVNQHFLRDKLNKLLKWFQKKGREELSTSGIDPELNEKAELLEEIVEKMESTVPINLSKKGKDDQDKHAAKEVRNLAMETLGYTQKRKSENTGEKVAKKKRSGNEAVEFLKERTQQEYELKKAEMEAKKHAEEASNRHVEQQQQFQATLMQLLMQQQQDHARQQEQQQQLSMLLVQQQQQILTCLQQISRKTQ